MRGQQTEADRIAELERDPQCSQFDAHRCLCAACGRWVHLSGRAHKIFNWRRHKKGCTLQKARGAITIIQSKSPQQRTLLNDHVGRLEDGIRMNVDDELEFEKRSVYAHSDDGYYDAPPSPNTTHSSISNKSANDKRYLQLPSITTFALSPTGSTSTPPLTSSDAASCSTTTSESSHSLISSWSQSQPQPYAQGVSQTGSWGRASHRPRGASTSSFRSLPPLSATSSVTVTSTAASPPTTSKHYYRPRGGPTPLVSCEGCQTRLDAHDWNSHKRSCKAYSRVHQHQLESGHNYHHTHSLSQPTTILPPLITTTSPNSEPSHVNLLHPSSSISILNARHDGSYKHSGDASTATLSESLLIHPPAQLHPHRHSPPPRLSIDTSFSRSGSNPLHRDPAAVDRDLTKSKLSLTAAGDHSHISLPHSYCHSQVRHESSYDSPHVKILSQGRSGIQSRTLGDGDSFSPANEHPRHARKQEKKGSLALLGHKNPDTLRPSSRASSQADPNHSPTSTKSSSGRSSLKISDLCHPSPPRSPDSEVISLRSSFDDWHRRSRSISPRMNRSRSWSRRRSVSRSAQYRYPARPGVYQLPSFEDNSTTPTHTPLLRTSTSESTHSRLNIFRSAIPFHLSSHDHEDSSSGPDIRRVRYNYSQSRSTFRSEPDAISISDSSYDSEDEQDIKLLRLSRNSPLRSLSPPSPYISDA